MGTTGNEGFSPSAIPGVGYPVFASPGGGVQIPLGGRLGAFVHADGWSNALDGICSSKDVVKTLDEGLARCRAGYPDVVLVLPGHTENVASADAMSSLVAGTQIIGLGHGTMRPTFTWSTATSTFLIDQNDIKMHNLILEMAGPSGTTALTVAAPMTVSGTNFHLSACRVHVEIDADQSAEIPFTTTAAADDMTISDSYIYGSGNGTLMTTCIKLVGADRFKMINTHMDVYGKTTTVGVIQMATTASYQILIKDCQIINRKAASTEVVEGLAASTGLVTNTVLAKLGDDNITLATAWAGSDNMQFDNVRIVNAIAENAATATTVSA